MDFQTHNAMVMVMINGDYDDDGDSDWDFVLNRQHKRYQSISIATRLLELNW